MMTCRDKKINIDELKRSIITTWRDKKTNIVALKSSMVMTWRYKNKYWCTKEQHDYGMEG